jgi:glycosyltransferase involved in cell wall biosynthesis
MATYNGAKFLREQLDSLAAQSLPPSEVVIADDCSSDESRAVAADFARTAPFPVRAFRNDDQLGYKRNFLRAVGLCASDLIACCDQDDVWDPAKLERATQPFADPNVMLVHHNSYIVSPSGEVLGLLRSSDIARDAAPHESNPWFAAYGHTLTFRKALAQFSPLWERSVSAHSTEDRIVRFGPEPESHDHWFFFLASEMGRVVYLPEPLVRYRQHDGNAEGWGGPMSYRRRWRHRLERRDLVYDLCAKSAAARSAILSEASRLAPKEDYATIMSEGSQRYERLAWLYERRAELYRSSHFGSRLRHFASLTRGHAYDGRGFWTFHAKGGIKDAILGLMFAPVLRYAGTPPSGADPTCSAVRSRLSPSTT